MSTRIYAPLRMLLFLNAVAFALPIRGQAAQTTAASIQAAQPELTTKQIAQRVTPAVVTIDGVDSEGRRSAGSGFLVDASGIVITNLHVIEDLAAGTVTLASGESYDRFTVRSYDVRRDLAVIQILGYKLPTVRLGESFQVDVGDQVTLIGSPLGFLTGSVATGVISGKRSVDGYQVFQTDAAASPGNSGGPLLNDRGEAIGVLTFKLRAGENLNFVVPVEYVKGMLTESQSLSLPQLRGELQKSARRAPDRDPPAAESDAPVTARATPKLGFTGNAGLLLVQVKPNQTAAFEELVSKLQASLSTTSDAALKAQGAAWKIYEASEPMGGNALYVVVVDPAVAGTEYDPIDVLYKTMTDEQKRAPKTQKMFKRFVAAFAGVNKLNLRPLESQSSILPRLPAELKKSQGAPAPPKLGFTGNAGLLLVQVKPDQTAAFEEARVEASGIPVDDQRCRAQGTRRRLEELRGVGADGRQRALRRRRRPRGCRYQVQPD